MGPLRPRTIKILGIRDGPLIETKIKRYTDFLHKEGPLQCTETIIACVVGGGIVLITSLPERLSKKCKRQGISYKLGDVIVTVDMLTKASEEISMTTSNTTGTIEYIKNTSIKMRGRAMLVNDLLLPADLQDINRSQILPFESRSIQQGATAINAYRLQSNDIEVLKEQDN